MDPVRQPPFRYPTRTKVIVVVGVAVAIAGFVFAGLRADTDPTDDVAVSGTEGSGDTGTARDPDGVIRLSPTRNAPLVNQQDTIELQLVPGWQGELALISGRGLVPLPADEVEIVAPNRLRYTPGPDRALERLPQGRNCVKATIWDQVQGREESERVVENWCFDVV